MSFTLVLQLEPTRLRFAEKNRTEKCSPLLSFEKVKKTRLVFHFISLTAKSSPTGRSDKCYYYAPEYNLNRFEEGQGYIANNHFNAKVSSISFNGVFNLMSVRLGDYWLKLSTTVALNRIRLCEEMEMGWRKNEVGLPAEFRDLDPVHVIPLERV